METDGENSQDGVSIGEGAKSGRVTGSKAPEVEPSLSFSFSIPSAFMDQLVPETVPMEPRPKQTPICTIKGCKAPRKYRIPFPSGEEKGACGLPHYKLVKAG